MKLINLIRYRISMRKLRRWNRTWREHPAPTRRGTSK